MKTVGYKVIISVISLSVFFPLVGSFAFNSPETEVSPVPSTTTPAVTRPTPSLSTAQSQPGRTLISKATGVDYTQLRDFLAAGKWKEADEETSRAMLQAAQRDEEGWLRTKDIENFSCEDLRLIDQLWLESSQGQFGFSVQKNIYQNLVGTRAYNRATWFNFAETVGWKQGNNWVYYSDLTFNLNAPKGQLPYRRLTLTPPRDNFYTDNGWGWGLGSFVLALRTVTCKL